MLIKQKKKNKKQKQNNNHVMNVSMMPNFSTISKDTNTLNMKVVKTPMNVYIETQFIIKAVDDNINVDKNDKTEDIKKGSQI